MQEVEFAKFVVEDTMKMLAHAVAVYVTALAAYWTFIG
jgi:hypothetical protein